MTNQSGGPNIIVRLTVEATKFLNNIKNVFGQATKLANNFQTQFQSAFGKTAAAAVNQINVAAKNLTTSLQNNIKALEFAKNSTLGWAKAWNSFALAPSELAKGYKLITDASQRYNLSLQQSAQLQISLGNISVEAAQKILSFKQKRLLSEQEINKALLIQEQNVLRVANGESILSKSLDSILNKQKNIASGTKKSSSTDSGGFSIGKQLGGILSGFSIIQALGQAKAALEDVAKRAIDVSQANFNLAVSVKAANIAVGSQIGSLKDWQGTISRLRGELKTFSKEDITKATTQVLGLTKNLNLAAGDMEKIIEVAAVLAQTTGVDLNQAVSDVVHALGGSRVVLDKYGLFLRDADLRVQSFSMGLGENTAALTSQELALVTLNAILKQVGPTMQSVGNYTDTLAGKTKEFDAAIEDSKNKTAENFGQMALLFKSFEKIAIESIENITTAIAKSEIGQFFSGTIKALIDAPNAIQKIKSIPVPEYKDFGLQIKSNKFGVLEEVARQSTNEIRYEDEFVPGVGDLGKYLKAVEEYRMKVRRLLGITDPNKVGDSFEDRYSKPPSNVATEDNEAFLEAEKDYGEKWEEIKADYIADITELEDNYNDARLNTFVEENQKLIDLLRDYEDQKLKILQDYKRDVADAGLDYQRDLEDLNTDAAQKEEDLLIEKNEKLKKNQKDYYDELKLLEMQYLFDLYDAVSANDAIAIKRLQRKFALDKAKLDDKYNNQNGDTESEYKKRLERLRKETEDRRKELDLRYKRELEDLKLERDRKLKDLEDDLANEKDKLKRFYENQRVLLKAEFERERQERTLKYGRDIQDLDNKLRNEKQLTAAQINQIKTLWSAYYEWALRQREEYFEELNDLNDTYDNGTIAPPTTGGGNPGGGGTVSPPIIPLSPQLSTPTSFSSNNQHTIFLTADQTVKTEVLEAVAGNLADIFESVIVDKSRL